MYGAILGDMIGAPYEFDQGDKTKDFSIFSNRTQFTDDTVMTVAVAQALMESEGQSDDEIKAALVTSMQSWGRRYPHAGYGGMFARWLGERHPQPYGSYGNGSAMRVSSAGWLYDSIGETRRHARLSAEVTHNHPEGIKGAEATAAAIYMARTGSDKDEIRRYITDEFGYDLSRSCDEIRPAYHHVETCQQTVHQAITAFLEGEDFEDVIRTAVSLGGDCDTLTCIAGGIAEAFYGVPQEMKDECRRRLPEDMLRVLDDFEDRRAAAEPEEYDYETCEMLLEGNVEIEAAIDAYYADSCRDTLAAVLCSIRERMKDDGHLIIPARHDGKKKHTLRFVLSEDGTRWPVVFTSTEEYEKSDKQEGAIDTIYSLLMLRRAADMPGFIINPWGQSFMLTGDLAELILKADEDGEDG